MAECSVFYWYRPSHSSPQSPGPGWGDWYQVTWYPSATHTSHFLPFLQPLSSPNHHQIKCWPLLGRAVLHKATHITCSGADSWQVSSRSALLTGPWVARCKILQDNKSGHDRPVQLEWSVCTVTHRERMSDRSHTPHTTSWTKHPAPLWCRWWLLCLPFLLSLDATWRLIVRRFPALSHWPEPAPGLRLVSGECPRGGDQEGNTDWREIRVGDQK